jgi:hypothetical protein
MRREDIQVANYGDWVMLKGGGRVPKTAHGREFPVIGITSHGNAVVRINERDYTIKNDDILRLYVDPRRSGSYPDKCIAEAQRLGIRVVRQIPGQRREVDEISTE